MLGPGNETSQLMKCYVAALIFLITQSMLSVRINHERMSKVLVQMCMYFFLRNNMQEIKSLSFMQFPVLVKALAS